MLKTILVPFVLPLLLLFSNGSDHSVARFKESNNSSEKSVSRLKQNSPQIADSQTGTQEKMIVAHGSVSMEIDLNRLNGIDSSSQINTLRFVVAPNSFFPILVFNNLLRGALPGSLELILQDSAVVPASLNSSFNQLVIEKLGWN